jgi:hypothetical protein
MPEALGCPIVPKRAGAALEVIGLNVVLVMVFSHMARICDRLDARIRPILENAAGSRRSAPA